MMLADYKFQILDRVDERYFRNAERVKKAAAKARIEIIPAVFSIGYSNGILAHDPNLAEGILARDVPHVVRNGVAELQPLAEAQIKNGGFEQAQENRFPGFSFQDAPGQSTFADRQVVHAGSGSCRIEPGKAKSEGGNARVVQNVKVRPHACYRLSAWVKTKDLAPTGSFHLVAMGAASPGRTLTFREGGVDPTQDWKKIDVVFNSLDQTAVNLYAGFWGDGSGTLWIDDLQLEELSLVNVLQAQGMSALGEIRGRQDHVRGRPRFRASRRCASSATFPTRENSSTSTQGPRLRLTARSRIKDGAAPARELVSPDPHPRVADHVLPERAQGRGDPPRPGPAGERPVSSPNLLHVARRDPVRQLVRRVPGTQADSRAAARRERAPVRGDSQAGQPQGADRRLVRHVRPHHNAVDQYYLVNGTLKGSWEGLPREVIIANWNSGKAKDSLTWFASRGHRQVIAGYYDADDLSGLAAWKSAAQGRRWRLRVHVHHVASQVWPARTVRPGANEGGWFPPRSTSRIWEQPSMGRKSGRI